MRLIFVFCPFVERNREKKKAKAGHFRLSTTLFSASRYRFLRWTWKASCIFLESDKWERRVTNYIPQLLQKIWIWCYALPWSQIRILEWFFQRIKDHPDRLLLQMQISWSHLFKHKYTVRYSWYILLAFYVSAADKQNEITLWTETF